MDWRFLLRSAPELWAGFAMTGALALAALVGALVWVLVLLVGLLFGGRAIRATANCFIEFWCNTPLLLQMYFIFFALPALGLRWSGFACGAISVALQNGAFLARILHVSIQSVSEKQIEAGKAIGLSRLQIARTIVVPQGVGQVLGPISNQLVMLIKDTSIVSAIGVLELTLIGKQLTEQSARAFEVFFAVGAMFLVLTTLTGILMRAVEDRYRARF